VATNERRVMLAVLPFDNLSSDPSHDYLAEGITEELITQLGRWNPARLGVIARTSRDAVVMRIRNRVKSTPTAIGSDGTFYAINQAVLDAVGK
jgi:TolB-like protein